jgi:hypothetical protein
VLQSGGYFCFFGFNRNILVTVELSALPPTGFEDSFCKKIPFKKGIFKIDGKFIGGVENKSKSTIISQKKSSIEINDNCYVSKEFFYVGGNIINISISIADSNL